MKIFLDFKTLEEAALLHATVSRAIQVKRSCAQLQEAAPEERAKLNNEANVLQELLNRMVTDEPI